MNKKLIIFGTRPEFIKLLPVILEIQSQNLEKYYCFIYTGQHTDMVDGLFEIFDFTPTFTIPGAAHYSSLSQSFSHILSGIQEIIDNILREHQISIIIGQGDTTSSTCAAMCAFFNHIPFGHIEAGLRTNNLSNPFPEELFRKIISLATTIHFTPTLIAQRNLLREGIRKESIILTGNTIVDAVQLIKPGISKKIINYSAVNKFTSRNNVLITCHRRENQTEKIHILVDTIKLLAVENPSLNFIWIAHKTPFIQNILANVLPEAYTNIYILPPLNVYELFYLYEKSIIIITDSGGIQEEAPSFNIPVIVLREYTERLESIEMGYSVLSEFNKIDLINAFNKINNQPPVIMRNPYGDSQAAKIIVNYLHPKVLN